ncbi:cell division control protein 14 [Xylona heveae TC161]|uniref:Cell division control protein 14 n=1 Tax=Xylona heveae (strain CBS 132557 / TC161) TaxID=1328760 RepID=A0A165HJR4_XYLHT|nr:cell division control protein 14 [Xylona heveae TC161]KZF23619.1 cell division control protein 14 [Xylona heveae TC161]
MEALLSHSFDYLSSYESGKIRKGLRQIEGLLAQICLSSSNPSPPDRRRNASQGHRLAPPKRLESLREDPAFREFFKLQEGFQWNVALRLISCLERLLGKGSNGQNDLLIIATLDLIQGALLLHPPSRCLFAREIYMNLLLDLLDPCNCPAIQSSTLLTLVCALLDQPRNTRTFEILEGLLTVTSLFKMRSTSREVKIKLVEFLYFYLMPETAPLGLNKSALATPVVQRTPSRLGGLSRSASGGAQRDLDDTRTTEQKQALLGKFLNNVEDLVADLRDNAPFEGTVY